MYPFAIVTRAADTEESLSYMISFEEAQQRVVALGTDLAVGVERVGVDAARGRVLGEDLWSPSDLPGFDHSAMDGYAVAVASFAGSGPWTLPVLGESKAGGVPDDLLPGCACRIFTGAQPPRGADAVVMQERVERAAERAVFDAKPEKGAFVRRRGEDLERGRSLSRAGRVFALRTSGSRRCAIGRGSSSRGDPSSPSSRPATSSARRGPSPSRGPSPRATAWPFAPWPRKPGPWRGWRRW